MLTLDIYVDSQYILSIRCFAGIRYNEDTFQGAGIFWTMKLNLNGISRNHSVS